MNEAKLIGCFAAGVLLIIILSLVFMFTGLHINTGEGQHTGYITAVQKQGIFFKTWRVYIKTDVSSSQEDNYCVIDEKLIDELQKKSESRERVTVTYFDWLIAGVTNCANETDIIKGIK